MNALTTSPSHGFSIEGMNGAMRLAEAMSQARMVPKHLQGSPSDCLMVIEQAMRWKMSPFAVAQATSVFMGKMCFEGKLISAAIQTSGILDGRLNYEFSGEKDNRKVVCSGLIKGENKARSVEVNLSDAKTENQWWKKTPDQMLTYYAARVWARRHTPEVILGVYAPEEMSDSDSNSSVIDVEPTNKTSQHKKINQQNPIDHIELIKARLPQATASNAVIKLENKWQQTIVMAKEQGKPIPNDVIDAVQDLIADRYGELRKQEEQDALNNANEEIEDMPA